MPRSIQYRIRSARSQIGWRCHFPVRRFWRYMGMYHLLGLKYRIHATARAGEALLTALFRRARLRQPLGALPWRW
jgi:hypothetical protein